MKKVLLPDPVHEAGMKLLEGKVEVVVAPDTSKETILTLVEGVHGIVLRTTAKIDKDVIEKAKDLLVISRTGAGVDNVDVEEATKRGIMVCNLPGANALSVAEHTVAFILALAKQLKFMDTSTRRGEWKNRNKYQAVDLEGKVLGLVGAGKIGQKVAKICQQAFQMKVIAYDPYVGKGGEVKGRIEFKDRIGEVFEEADFVSVHVAGTPQTRRLITWELFCRMKKDAYFINTSRGEVIDEEALIRALKEKKIKGAALDVFSDEPPSPDNPLLSMENVILTPHSASLTRECVIRLAQGACQAVLAVFSGKLPQYIYNRKQLEELGFIKDGKFIRMR